MKRTNRSTLYIVVRSNEAVQGRVTVSLVLRNGSKGSTVQLPPQKISRKKNSSSSREYKYSLKYELSNDQFRAVRKAIAHAGTASLSAAATLEDDAGNDSNVERRFDLSVAASAPLTYKHRRTRSRIKLRGRLRTGNALSIKDYAYSYYFEYGRGKWLSKKTRDVPVTVVDGTERVVSTGVPVKKLRRGLKYRYRLVLKVRQKSTVKSSTTTTTLLRGGRRSFRRARSR